MKSKFENTTVSSKYTMVYQSKSAKQKQKNKIYLYFLVGLIFLLSMINMVLAYSDGGIPIGNLWDVSQLVFGSFFITIIVFMIIFLIILAIGGISAITIILFEFMFLESMLLGYGYEFPVIILNTLIIFYSFTQVMRLINQGDF